MNIRPLACLGLLCALASAAHAQTAAPVSLRYKFTPGEVRTYKITLDMTMHMALPGSRTAAAHPMPAMIEHMTMLSTQTVQSVSSTDGSATLHGTYAMQDATLNGKPIPNLGAAMASMNKGYTMVMSPQGKVLSMTLPGMTTGAGQPPMDFSKLGSMLPAALPAAPIKVGDTWKGDIDTSHMFGASPMPGMDLAMRSTLTGIEPGVAPGTSIADIHQTFHGDIGSHSAIAPTAMTVTGAFDGSTLIKFDIAKGDFSTQDADMTMHMSIGSPSSPSGPMRMNMVMKTHTERVSATP